MIKKNSDYRNAPWIENFIENRKKLQEENLRKANLEHLDSKVSNEEFKTIDAKMKDIKSRIGFEKLLEYRDEDIQKQSKSDCACKLNEKKSCGCTYKKAYDKIDVERMKNILSYIKDLISHEPHLSSQAIIQRCRGEEDLYFEETPINTKKLLDYINSLLDSNKKTRNVSYIPNESISYEPENDVADYYNHAFPRK